MAKNIYLASPFFDDEQIARVEKIERALENNLTVSDYYDPRLHQHEELKFGTHEWQISTYNSDIKAVEAADAIVAVVDFEGQNVDSGTAMEIGYAVKKGTPILIFQEKEPILNLMFSVPVHAYMTNAEEIAQYDFETMKKIPYKGKVV
ncbi:nucleoside 2-deoxyribosyltransferase [Oenococcus sp. UCMA 16435]|nr:nucleoside 2-deoxyribosyltransferase [Oenococcus sp. UCMA 16435]MDI4584037.1 nucleoside 2-deoxyribosyltransferase [Oenococcus sp. UCMA 14587]